MNSVCLVFVHLTPQTANGDAIISAVFTVVAQKTPAEDNANLAFLDKFQDYKSATNAIFVSEYSNRLQLMHPHMLLLYTLALLSWPNTLGAKVVPLCTNLQVFLMCVMWGCGMMVMVRRAPLDKN